MMVVSDKTMYVLLLWVLFVMCGYISVCLLRMVSQFKPLHVFNLCEQYLNLSRGLFMISYSMDQPSHDCLGTQMHHVDSLNKS